MQVVQAWITPEERQRRQDVNAYFYCGKVGHFSQSCPFKGSCPPVRIGGLVGTVQNHSPIQQSYLPVLLIHGVQSNTPQALIDSGSEKNLICSATARSLGIPLLDLDQPLTVQTLDGSTLNHITRRTAPVLLGISCNHSEVIVFYVMETPHVRIVLGFPWLSLSNPHVNWSDNTIFGWSLFCLSSCLKSALTPVSPSPATEEFPDLSKVPHEYMDLKPVFNKSHAVFLPPHRPYDCATSFSYPRLLLALASSLLRRRMDPCGPLSTIMG